MCTGVTVSLESWEKKSNNSELVMSKVTLPNITRAWREAFPDCIAGKQCQGDPGLVPLSVLLSLEDTLLSSGLLFHGHKIVTATPGIVSWYGQEEGKGTKVQESHLVVLSL